MCGITGIFNTEGSPASVVVLRSMTEALAHRGPDGDGVYVDGSVGLGHRRLAILDLSPSGHQPMAFPGGDLVITYNGEVYNFLELRAELEAKGHQFHSRSDTEVVLHAYQEWGAECLGRFNGMFAFAIYDRRERSLFLARDRYGIKPLYFVQRGDAFLFGSEIKAFLVHPAFDVEVDLPRLLEYFTFQNVLSTGTLFAGVQLLPPGHHMTVRASGPGAPVCYWDYHFAEPDQALGPEEYAEELDRLFVQAVQRQLVSDTTVGAYLSGGLDSGGITAVASRSCPYLTTFTGGFDMTSISGLELAFDERVKAEALSYRFKTEHYEVVLKAGDMERCLPDLVWHLEDLRVGQSYPNYYVARLASKFVKSVLAGTGGDELFAGYPWRYYQAAVNSDFSEYVSKYYVFWHRLIPNRYMPRLFQPEVWEQIKSLRTIGLFQNVLEGASGSPPVTPAEYVNRSLYFEAKTFLHGLLVVEDRLSMAHGLETRVPFLDNDLVDFALRVPVRSKLKELHLAKRWNENEPYRYKRTNDGKLLLRDVMKRYVPKETAELVKQGFSGPDSTWFRGDSIDFVKRIVLDPHSRIYEYFRPDTLQEFVAEHLAGTVNRRLLIWSVLCFEFWLRRFRGGP